MTMPPVATPMPMLNPQDPHQMASYFGAWLYATEPTAIEDAWRNIGEQAANWVTTYLEQGMASMGMKRGNPQERMAAYVRKFTWPTDRGPDGLLLHPIMNTQPVIDPMTGMPMVDQMGQPQMQQVATEQGEDLWDEQLQQFPRQFLIDARDAFDMGAPLPVWVEQLVLETKTRDATPEGKRALKNASTTTLYKPKKALVAA